MKTATRSSKTPLPTSNPSPASRRRSPRLTGPAARWFALAALGVVACEQEQDHGIEIRYTEYGIPHVQADDYESVGLGQGYAQARDNLCDIEHGMLAFEGRLSRYFGADAKGSWLSGNETSLGSDLYFGAIREGGVVEQLLRQAAPLGPRDEVRQVVRGYVRGFNRRLAERPAVQCSGAAWLRPMTELDVYRRAYAMSLTMGQSFFGESIVTAAPPLTSSTPASESTAALMLPREQAATHGRPGSNGIALGSEATQNGHGLNVANPHLRWEGDLRWGQAQLTIPGALDVAGAGVLGLPLIVMGHNQTLAWSITTAEATRHFMLFELQLVPGEPTSYLVDGKPEPMQRRDVRVDVLQADGSVESVTKALWWTRYGPIGGPLPWEATSGGGHAYAVGDANASNMRMLNTVFAIDHARDVNGLLRALRETQGAPWWTVIAADAEGQTLFSQLQVVSNISDAHAERCSTDAGRATLPADGLAILDGSRSECAWQTDDDALEPGIFGPGTLDNPRMPVLITRKYVANSNDSHWLPNAEQRITGMARILGDEGSVRGVRTRDTMTEIEDQLRRAPFTLEDMQEMMLSHRSYAAELVLDDTLSLCRAAAGGVAEGSEGQSVDVREACSVLGRWDRRMDIESRGALLFDRYWRRATELAQATGAELMAVPFDAADPLRTPHTLDIAGPIASRALADAVSQLAAAGVPLDAELGQYQYTVRGGRRIPFGGGTDVLGVLDLQDTEWSDADGYSRPYSGSGYLHIVELDGTPCPNGATLLTYSQAVEPSSPHHRDQTELYSEKRWVNERFCESDILASPALEVIQLGR